MEQDVWNRVARRELPGGGAAVAPLLQSAWENLGVYRLLLAGERGPKRRLLEALASREEEMAQALWGLGKLSAEPLPGKAPPPPRADGALLLRQCYHRSLGLQREFLARAALAEWGLVFRALAEEMEEQCLRLVRLLG